MDAIPIYIKNEAIKFVGMCRAHAYMKNYKQEWIKHQYLSRYPNDPLTLEEYKAAKPTKPDEEYRRYISASHKKALQNREYAPSKRFLANRSYYDERMARSGMTPAQEVLETAKPMTFEVKFRVVTGEIKAVAMLGQWHAVLNVKILKKHTQGRLETLHRHPAQAIDDALNYISKKLMLDSPPDFDEFINHRQFIHESAWAEVTPTTRAWLQEVGKV